MNKKFTMKNILKVTKTNTTVSTKSKVLLSFLLILISSFAFSNKAMAQTPNLGIGDIAITSFYSDGGDRFSFVNLVPITANTEIFFSDKQWDGIALVGTSGSASDGIIRWFTTSAIATGTQITITGLTPSQGSVTAIVNAATGLNFSTAGDQLFAFQGPSTSPTFLAGLHYNYAAGPPVTNDPDWDGSNITPTSNTTSRRPPTLITGTYAMRAAGIGAITEFDNGKLNCAGLPKATKTLALAYINDDANWVFDTDGTSATGGTFPSCPSYIGTPPTGILVTSFTGTTPSASNTVTFNLTLDMPIASLTPANFTTTVTGGMQSALVMNVAGSGTSWTVTVTAVGGSTGTVTCNFTNASVFVSNLPFASNAVTINPTIAAPNLALGDIAITSYYSDNGDRFSFVNLVPLTANTEIFFSDKQWTGTALVGTGGSVSDGIIKWLTTTAIPVGTQITISGITASQGIITSINNTAAGINLSTAGDQIFAFQGPSTSPTFLAGLHYNVLVGPPATNDANWDDATQFVSTSNTGSGRPPTLTTGTYAMRAGVEFDNGKLNCSGLPAATKALALAYINDDANWVFDNDGTTATGGTYPSCALYFGTAPTPIAVTSFTGTTPSTSNTVTFNLTLDMPIASLTPANFTTTLSGGMQSALVTSVTGSGTSWTVTVTAVGGSTGTVTCNFTNAAVLFSNLPYASNAITINPIIAAPNLALGDIAITSYFSDGGDRFSFVNLVPLTANTEIFFSDKQWTGTALVGTSGSASDGIIKWLTTTAIPVGTQITITGLVASQGTITSINNTAAGLNFSTSGDQIFAFQGPSTSPTFLAGLHYNVLVGPPATDDANWDDATLFASTSNTGSGRPPTLTTGTYAMRAGVEFDNGKLNCSGLPAADRAALLAYVNDDANWVFDNDLLTIGTAFPACPTFLIVCVPTTATINPTICPGATYTSPSTNYTWTAAGTYMDTIMNAGGCDSVLTINLALTPAPAAPTANSLAVCGTNIDTTLVATGGADGYAWYATDTGTTAIANTDTLSITGATTTTTYYVETFTTTPYAVGPLDNSIGTGGIYFAFVDGLVFNTTADIVLDSVTIYPGGVGNVVVNLEDASNTIIATTTVAVTTAGMQRIPIGFSIPVGTGYELNAAGSTVSSLFRNTAGAVYPYTDAGGNVSITGAINNLAGYYYFFYDWKISAKGCTSPRTAAALLVSTTPPTFAITSSPASAICQGDTVTLTLPNSKSTAGVASSVGTAGAFDIYPVDNIISGLSTSGITLDSVTIHDLNHTFPSDLEIMLVSPTMDTVMLMTDAGGGGDIANVELTFSDVATQTIDAALLANTTGAIFGTPFVSNTASISLPQQPVIINSTLSTFTGNMNGNWQLFVFDDAGGDAGSFTDYTLHFSNPLPTSFAWSPSPLVLSTGMDTAMVSPAATTKYFVTATAANGCSATDSVEVMVNNPMITSLIASDTVVCAGSTVTLEVRPGLAGVSIPFCVATYSSGTGLGDFIDSVGGFGGLLQNQTGAGAAPYYQLFPTPIPVTTATPYTVTVRNGNFGDQEQSIWIDYNHDSIFQVTEQVGQFNSIAANALTTFTVNIPTSAYNGTTLMRVMDDYQGPTPVMDPCRAAGFGETEDYVLDISGGINAPAPFDSIAWTPSTYLDTTTQATVNAINMLASTTYTVTGFYDAGCSVSDSISIVVDPSPTGNIVSNPIVVASLPYVDTNDNLSSNCWSDQGTHAGNRAGNDVFYQFVMPGCTDSVVATLCNTATNWDTYMHLLDNTGATVTSNDDDCGVRSTINWGGLVKGATYYIVVDGIGATNQDSFIVNIDAYEPVIAASLAQATSNQTILQGDGSTFNYYNPSCELIANITDSTGGNTLGNTVSTVTVDATAGFNNGQPFGRRWYQITPTSNGAADVTLYFTQADFDDLNAVTVAPYLQLPTAGSNTDPNIPNIRITKNDDTGLGNNPIVLTPTVVNWNGSYWEVTVTTPSFSQFRIHSLNANNTPLPVSLLNFTVRKESTVDVVEWTTVNEQNNKHFNVQRSANGNDFTTLGTVETKATNGNSTGELSYSFVDAKPMTGHNYYRLEQVDIDNKTNLSKVIDIVWGNNGGVVAIYPNPATDKLNIDITTSEVAQTEIKLVDMSGRVVKSVLTQTLTGLNHITLGLNDLATGIYGVQVFENNKLTHVSKLRKN